MQVTLGKWGDYSVRAVLELTRHRAVHGFWLEAQAALGERLAATSFAQLAERESEVALSTSLPSVGPR